MLRFFRRGGWILVEGVRNKRAKIVSGGGASPLELPHLPLAVQNQQNGQEIDVSRPKRANVFQRNFEDGKSDGRPRGLKSR